FRRLASASLAGKPSWSYVILLSLCVPLMPSSPARSTSLPSPSLTRRRTRCSRRALACSSCSCARRASRIRLLLPPQRADASSLPPSKCPSTLPSRAVASGRQPSIRLAWRCPQASPTAWRSDRGCAVLVRGAAPQGRARALCESSPLPIAEPEECRPRAPRHVPARAASSRSHLLRQMLADKRDVLTQFTHDVVLHAGIAVEIERMQILHENRSVRLLIADENVVREPPRAEHHQVHAPLHVVGVVLRVEFAAQLVVPDALTIETVHLADQGDRNAVNCEMLLSLALTNRRQLHRRLKREVEHEPVPLNDAELVAVLGVLQDRVQCSPHRHSRCRRLLATQAAKQSVELHVLRRAVIAILVYVRDGDPDHAFA